MWGGVLPIANNGEVTHLDANLSQVAQSSREGRHLGDWRTSHRKDVLALGIGTLES